MASSILDPFTGFWSSDIWLPPNITWETIEVKKRENDEHGNIANFGDLSYSIPLAFTITLVRILMEKMMFEPLACWLCNDLLANKLKKFTEACWRFFFYTSILLYGVCCLWYKPWLWSVRQCWVGYPFHSVSTGVWHYYMLELAFYLSLTVTQFFDVKRKDFWEMFVHHITTIALILFSWSSLFIRIGTLVLLIHDSADPFLELAKIMRYINYEKTCNFFFVIFTIVWVVTRCLIFPIIILASTLYDASNFIDMFPAYFIFNTLLIILQCLHIIWTYFVVKVVCKSITTGNVEDERSDSEESEDENINDKSKDD